MTTIACANRKAHDMSRGQHHHQSVSEVRQCHQHGGLKSIEEQNTEPQWDTAMQPDRSQAAPKRIDMSYRNPYCIVQDRTVVDGIYTVSAGEKHYTFKIKTQPDDAEFAPSTRVLYVLSGPNNTSDYRGIGFVSQTEVGSTNRTVFLKPWRSTFGMSESSSIWTSAVAMLQRPDLALEAGTCFKCGRLLTTPESLALGLGSHCAKKVGA